MTIVLCVQLVVGTTKRLRVTKQRDLTVNVDVTGTDTSHRCTVTRGRWYRTHAERGRREIE
jgi:hypothetical protein